MGPYSPKHCSVLLKFWPDVAPIRKTLFKKSFKTFNSSINGRHPKFTVLFLFGAQFTTGKPKILLKTKISAKTASLGKSNSVRPRSQKNHRILVKLNKKETIFWAQTGSKLPPSPVVAPKGYQKFSNSQVSLSVYFLFSTLPGRSTTFFGVGPNCGHFGGFGGNNSSTQHHIELKFWPLVVLIFVQILFKAFWKTWIFTETGDVHKVSVFGPTLKMAQIKNIHLAIQTN